MREIFTLLKKFAFAKGERSQGFVIDTSSILEHKDELKELWETKMMSNEHQVHVEESNKGEEELKSDQQGETPNGDVHKMSNGDVPKAESDGHGQVVEDACDSKNDNALPSQSETENKTDENKLSKINAAEEGEIIGSKENPSLETESALQAERVEEKSETQDGQLEVRETEVKEEIFTSTFQQTLVITKKQETTVVEQETVTKGNEVSLEDTQEDFEEIEARIEAEEAGKVELLPKAENIETAQEPEQKEEFSDALERPKEELDKPLESPKERELEENRFDIPEEIDSPDSLETIEIQDAGGDFEHYTVLENRSTENEITMNGVVKSESFYSSESSYTQEETLNVLTNEKITEESAFCQNDEVEEKTFDDHFVLDTREAISPTGDEDKKDSSSKKSRIHTLGVQKTEQPYSTCTTETKIAMEIREMREREEELKKMRERQAQISPVPPPQKTPTPSKPPTVQKPPPQPVGYTTPNTQKVSTPGYRVSSVFGSRGILQQQVKDESKLNRNFNKESPVEKEIRIAKDREEELRRQKGLPPREDDSYVKPSQVKSSQVKAFGKMINADNSRLIATAKIQHEIEEQTMREMALRETGHIQTLSCERTDAKVTKLKTLEVASPECTSPTFQNGVGSVYSNGTFSNGHTSPDYTSKRSTPSPTGCNYPPQYTAPRNLLPPGGNKGISMQKFIASRGKETAFASPRNGPFHPKSDYQDNSRSIPEPGKLKRTVSVESKIQQEILEMKRREDELKLLHTGRSITPTSNGSDFDTSSKTSEEYYQNGESDETEEMCPRRSNLIAQWEQRIQKSEGKA